MPIPAPRSGEKEDEFIGRCMSAIAGDSGSNEQKLAICYSKWGDRSAPLETPKLATLTSTGIAGVDLRRILPRAVRTVEGKPGRIHSYAALFGDEETLDLYGTFFNRDTDYALDWFDKRPWLYAHTGNNFVGGAKIGEWKDADMDDYGLFFLGELDERFRYLDEVNFLMSLGYLFPSSGTLSYAARIADDGWIERWPIVELSSTVAPAEWRIPAQQVDASRRKQAAQAIRTLGGMTMSEQTGVLARIVPGVDLGSPVPSTQEPAAAVRDADVNADGINSDAADATAVPAEPAPGEDEDLELELEPVTADVEPTGDALSAPQLQGIIEALDGTLKTLSGDVQGLRDEVEQLRTQQRPPDPVSQARALVDDPHWSDKLFCASREGRALPNDDAPGEPLPASTNILAQLASATDGTPDPNDVFMTILDSQRPN